MFLRYKVRRKDGKEHRYWSIVENRRVSGGRTVQRQVLYLGEINDGQKAAWCRTIEAFDEAGQDPRQIALFPEDRPAPVLDGDVVHVRLSGSRLHRPRQWGACWLACHLWDQLRLDDFWSPRLPASRQGTRWLNVLKTLVTYRLVDPGSEWRLHRQWYAQNAIGDLLGEDFAVAGKDNLYRCLDKLLAHKQELFSFLRQRWQTLFQADFEILLYDLTSTYFACDPPETGKRRCGQPRARLSQLEQEVLARPWAQVRDSVQVKLIEQDGELYILARSGGRRDKEQAMRRRRLKKLVKRLHELRQQKLTRDQLLIKLGAARTEAGPVAYRIIDIQLPGKDQPVTAETFCFKLNWQKLREARRREGSYLLRSNLTGGDPAKLWAFYLQLVEIEQAFKELNGDLAIRPIYHQTDARIEAHIFVAFLAYCLQVTLKQRLRALAPGLTPRSVLEKMASIQMVDMHLPTTDGRTDLLSRYPEPELDQLILLRQLKIDLPAQPS